MSTKFLSALPWLPSFFHSWLTAIPPHSQVSLSGPCFYFQLVHNKMHFTCPGASDCVIQPAFLLYLPSCLSLGVLSAAISHLFPQHLTKMLGISCVWHPEKPQQQLLHPRICLFSLLNISPVWQSVPNMKQGTSSSASSGRTAEVELL